MASQTREDPRPARSRAALLDATVRLLERGGVGAVTVDAVTVESGVARATLYRNYTTTGELIAAAFERMLPTLDVKLTGRSLRGDLLRVVSAYAHVLDSVPLHTTMLSWMALGPNTATTGDSRLYQLQRSVIERYQVPLIALLTDERARQELRPHSRSAAGLSDAVSQLAGPLLFNRLVTLRPNDRAFCTHLVDDYLVAHANHSSEPNREPDSSVC